MNNHIGRAGFDVRHLRRKDTGGSTRGDRKRLLGECMRELDPDVLAYQASHNPNIVMADAHLNVPFVNDGNGGFRRARSVDEVLAYQDARMEGVRIRKDSFETSLFAIHVPKSLCVEVPDYYVKEVDGVTIKRSRYVPRDYAEAQRYLLDAMKYLADNYIPGGIDAIAGGDMNFDESTPHIQFQADTLSPNPKDPGTLRCAPGIAYNTDKSVLYTSGPKKGQQVSGQVKLAAAHRGLREHMRALGYPVELDVSERAGESLDLDRYAQIGDRERVVGVREERVDDLEQAALARGMDTASEVMRLHQDAAAQELHDAQTEYQFALDLHDTAVHRARKDVEEEMKDDRDAAAQELAEARKERQRAQQEAYQASSQVIRAREDAEAERLALEAELSEAEARAQQVLDEAEARAQQVLDEAEQQAQQVRDAARADAGAVRDAAHADAEAVREQAQQMLESVDDLRNEMRQVDSDFLTAMIERHPSIAQAYERFVQDKTHFLLGNPDYYNRTVGENKQRSERRRKARQQAAQETVERTVKESGKELGD